MKRMLRVQVFLPAIVLLIAACTAAALQKGVKLMLDGKLISTDILIFKGRAYVPLSDVARGLAMTIVKQNKTYSLTHIGDANTIQGHAGKIADNILSKAWQFQVESLHQATEYSRQYGSEKEQLTPKETGDILLVIHCRIKNDTKAMQEVSFNENSAGNTALMDDQGHGYVPMAYDSRDSGYASDKMPSGSVHEFVIIFSVPKDAILKDLVYTVGGSGMDTDADFRVSLKS